MKASQRRTDNGIKSGVRVWVACGDSQYFLLLIIQSHCVLRMVFKARIEIEAL